MQRLYKFVRDEKRITGQTNVAVEMGESPQVLKNWESRGISQRGANQAQKKFGCDANWLLGKNTAPIYAPTEQPQTHTVSEKNPWAWPFNVVSRQQWDQLFEDERVHIENDILLRVKNRGDPLKEAPPAPNAANARSA